jgi:2-succinyl-6-hydroxy-2,4-cyclohexadiene-1-carboxylate synthase
VRTTFIHGFAGTPAAWDGIAPADAVRVWLPGHGRPHAGHQWGLTPLTWAAQLDAVAQGIGTPDVVVGYSLGARVALGLVATGYVPRAVLIGVNPGLTTEAERTERRASDARWAARLRTEGIEAFSDAWEAQALFATQARANPARLAARRAARRALDAEGLAQSLETMGLAEMPDYRGAFAGPEAIGDRVRLIVGADDAKYRAIAQALLAELIVIAGAGHDPTLEQPERLREAIAAIRW